MPRKTFASSRRNWAWSASGPGRRDFKCAAMSVKVKLVCAWMSTSAKPRLTWKAAAVQQEVVVRVRLAGGNGQLAQDGDMDVRVPALHVFPIRIIQSFGPERSAEFEQRVGGAHFFEREHVGSQRADAFTDFAARPSGFDVRTRFGRLIQIIFDVVSGNAESFGSKAVEKKRKNNNQREPAKDQFQIHQMVIIPASDQVKGQLCCWCKLKLEFHRQRTFLPNPAKAVIIRPCLERAGTP